MSITETRLKSSPSESFVHSSLISVVLPPPGTDHIKTPLKNSESLIILYTVSPAPSTRLGILITTEDISYTALIFSLFITARPHTPTLIPSEVMIYPSRIVSECAYNELSHNLLTVSLISSSSVKTGIGIFSFPIVSETGPLHLRRISLMFPP